jgi:hypothetical protein
MEIRTVTLHFPVQFEVLEGVRKFIHRSTVAVCWSAPSAARPVGFPQEQSHLLMAF